MVKPNVVWHLFIQLPEWEDSLYLWAFSIKAKEQSQSLLPLNEGVRVFTFPLNWAPKQSVKIASVKQTVLTNDNPN